MLQHYEIKQDTQIHDKPEIEMYSHKIRYN